MNRFFLKIGLFLFGLLILFLLLLSFFLHRTEPMLRDLSRARAAAAASREITQAVGEKIGDGSMDYEKIVCFEKDINGNITALKTNMRQVNSLKAQILKSLNERLLELTPSELSVPSGDLLLPELFSGRGVRIPVRILALRRSKGEFLSDFTQAGINQTLHRLSLRLQVEGKLLVLGKIYDFSASGTVLVAETVIVGQVPHTFS